MVLVAGSTGFLGREICRRLRARGVPVRALVRSSSDQTVVAALEALGAETVVGDVKNRASLDAAWIPPASGETLLRILPGKTLVYGETASQGPYRIRLNADGSAVVLRGR